VLRESQKFSGQVVQPQPSAGILLPPSFKVQERLKKFFFERHTTSWSLAATRRAYESTG
jgi:hypothetical protein